MLQIAYTYAVHICLHTNLYSAKYRENESEALHGTGSLDGEGKLEEMDF